MHNSSTSFSRSRCECSWCVRNICKYIYIYLCIYFLLVFAHWLCVVIEFIRLFFFLFSSLLAFRYVSFTFPLCCVLIQIRDERHTNTHTYTQRRDTESTQRLRARERARNTGTHWHTHTHTERRDTKSRCLFCFFFFCSCFALFSCCFE